VKAVARADLADFVIRVTVISRMLAMRQIAVGNQPVFSQPSVLPWGVYYHRFALQCPTTAFSFRQFALLRNQFGVRYPFWYLSPHQFNIWRRELRMNLGQDPQDRKELATFLLLNVTA
jgi:hypothetical protein